MCNLKLEIRMKLFSQYLIKIPAKQGALAVYFIRGRKVPPNYIDCKEEGKKKKKAESSML